MRALAAVLCVAVGVMGCLGDPVGPSTLFIVRAPGIDTLMLGAPGRLLTSPVRLRAVDAEGRGVPGVRVQWAVAGENARIDSSSAVTDGEGYARARWLLGTRAAERQALTADFSANRRAASVTLHAVAVPSEVASVRFVADTTVAKVGVGTRLAVEVADQFGNVFVPGDLSFASLDTAFRVDTAGIVLAGRRGLWRVVARAAGLADTGWVHGIQVVVRIDVPSDTFRFNAVGQVHQFPVQMYDDQGLFVADSAPAIIGASHLVEDSLYGADLLLQSRAPGVGQVTLRAGAVSRTLIVEVVQIPARIRVLPETLSFDALGDTATIANEVFDSAGSRIDQTALVYQTTDAGVATVTTGGQVASRANGSAAVTVHAGEGVVGTVSVIITQRLARVAVARDSLLFRALQVVKPMRATPQDRLGSPIVGLFLTYTSSDTGVATVSPAGDIRAISNGVTRITALAQAESVVVVATVTQQAVRVAVPSDTLRFVALGDAQTVTAVAVDSMGYPVSRKVMGLAVVNPAVVTQVDSLTIRSAGNGTTSLRFSVAGLDAEVVASVHQVATRILASLTDTNTIVDLPLNAIIPVACEARDRNDYVVPDAPTVQPSGGSRWTGARCDSLRVERSGYDTLRLSAGTALVELPVVIAVRPQVGAVRPLVVDSFPAGLGAWAPSARRNSSGEIEVYFGGSTEDTNGLPVLDLYRLTSTDGLSFHFEGPILRHSDDPCDPQGTGIENVSIVPRVDGPGWRMFYSAGSNDCYGWQVFSAVSTDERTWSTESGVRLNNGGTLPPDPPEYAPWPAGEGMVTDLLPDGTWRMIVSTYEHLTPAENKFQILEWRSPDQLNWAPLRTLISTRDLPPEGQRSAYSPTIRHFAPGLWRIVFTADDLNVGGRSRLWSAVSRDQVTWQLEGDILGEPGLNYFYSALVDDHLYTLEAPQDPLVEFTTLVTLTVTMP